jgi:hypothetical protein
MEIVGRMMDGSISYPPNEPRETPIVLGPKLGQDQKMGYLQRVPVLENCTRRQLRAISRIATVLETPAGQVLAREGEPGDHTSATVASDGLWTREDASFLLYH